MSQPDEFCRDASLLAGEPLWGTAAAQTDLWIVLETRQPWGPRGVEDSGLPPGVQERLSELARDHPRLRVQLIRRPALESARVPFALYLGSSKPDAPTTHTLALSQLEALVELDLDAWARGEHLLGDEVKEPVYLVCVHGRRDRCCAQHGMPLYSALSDLRPEHTWQTTHLGGHRFAATMLVLPQGICYGRVDASKAGPIVESHDVGEIFELAHVRGTTSYTPEEQAAEVMLRIDLDERRLDSLALVSSTRTESATQVCFLHTPTAREHERLIRREALPPIAASCGAEKKPVDRLVALRLPS